MKLSEDLMDVDIKSLENQSSGETIEVCFFTHSFQCNKNRLEKMNTELFFVDTIVYKKTLVR